MFWTVSGIVHTDGWIVECCRCKTVGKADFVPDAAEREQYDHSPVWRQVSRRQRHHTSIQLPLLPTSRRQSHLYNKGSLCMGHTFSVRNLSSSLKEITFILMFAMWIISRRFNWKIIILYFEKIIRFNFHSTFYSVCEFLFFFFFSFYSTFYSVYQFLFYVLSSL